MVYDTHPSMEVRHWFTPRPRPQEDQAFDAWLRRELGRECDDALDEQLPDELLDLVREMPLTRH
jgi:hypothetical protein